MLTMRLIYGNIFQAKEPIYSKSSDNSEGVSLLHLKGGVNLASLLKGGG